VPKIDLFLTPIFKLSNLVQKCFNLSGKIPGHFIALKILKITPKMGTFGCQNGVPFPWEKCRILGL